MDKKPEQKGPLRYVAAYGQLEEMIRGMSPGDKLPSENELARRLEISRGTLRQALMLLREDGIIYNHQGKGNFVRAVGNPGHTGIEKVHNNLLQFATVPVRQEVEVEYCPSTKKMQQYLELEAAVLLAQIHVLSRYGDETVAYRLYFIPYDNISRHGVNLEDNQQMLDFLSGYIGNAVVCSGMSVSCVEARESVAGRMGIPEGTPLLYFAETMRLKTGQVALYSKAYYNSNYFRFFLNRE